MRNLLIAGNWKMNLSRAESIQLAAALAVRYSSATEGVQIAICPPAVYLDAVSRRLEDSAVHLGIRTSIPKRMGPLRGKSAPQWSRTWDVTTLFWGIANGGP